MTLKKLKILKRPLQVSIAVAIALIVESYYSFSHERWIVISAFLVALNNYRMPLRQGLPIILLILIGLLVSSLISNMPFKFAIVILLLFLSALNYILDDSMSMKTRCQWVYLALIVMLGVLMPTDTTLLKNRVLDVSLGGLIGVLCSLIIFPFNTNDEFKIGITCILNKLHQFALQSTMLNKTNLENAMIIPSSPKWIFASGFNPGLREGYRFYLIHLEQVIDLYFALSQYTESLQQLSDVFSKTLANNAMLIDMISQYFISNQQGQTELDLTTDIVEMEKAVKQLVPVSIEMLDMSPAYLDISALATIIKDVRRQLLQLLMSLPKSL